MQSYNVTGGDNVSLHVDANGSNRDQPIVFVHGYSQSRLCWENQLKSDLTENFRLVAFDIRGHGNSGKPRNTYDDPELWADDVKAVIDSLRRKNPVLVGWSYGGLVISDYMAVHGTEDVAGVNYVDAISEKGTDDAAYFAGKKFTALAKGFETTEIEKSVETLKQFVELCVNGELDPTDLHFMLGYNLRTPPHVRKALQARTVVHEQTLKEIDVPVLLTHGAADSVVLPDAAYKHENLIPNANLSMYPNVGHSPFWEAPDRFNSELCSFVEGLQSLEK